MNTSAQRTVVCGKGRLGRLVIDALEKSGIACELARMDAQKGLIQDGQPVTGTINTLILCFVPKHTEGTSGWQGLLQGLLGQVQRGVLKIQRVLFVSSTAVYEAIEYGLVGVATEVKGNNVRSKGLLDAEQAIPQLASGSTIFRLTGLVGPGYNKYDPATYSMEKPRQAVDTRAVAIEIATWCSQKQTGHVIEVLTDGWVYWRGEKLDPEQDVKQLATLSKQHRLLIPSIVCHVV